MLVNMFLGVVIQFLIVEMLVVVWILEVVSIVVFVEEKVNV